MAERQPNNDWRVFNGNEIGAILGWWQIQRLKQSTIDSSSSNLSDYYLISSAVSSKILETFAKYEGFNFVETLTGFKWMGNLAFDLEHRQKKKVLLCFEEAIGFMVIEAIPNFELVEFNFNLMLFDRFLRSIP